MNCFQFVFLSGSLTTIFPKDTDHVTLWIAFNLYFYRVHWQQRCYSCGMALCCELLSICIFIGFIDNTHHYLMQEVMVVNCFQFVFLSGSLTTMICRLPTLSRLWIAFNLYFYRVHWQQGMPLVSLASSCELLSICIFIGFIDNLSLPLSRHIYVVNCFQFVFLSGSLTTWFTPFHYEQWLWIAFNLYFYRVHWQL